MFVRNTLCFHDPKSISQAAGQSSPWSGKLRCCHVQGAIVGKHSSMPTRGLRSKLSPGSFRNSFSPPSGCQSHSRSVCKFFSDMIRAPSFGTIASSTSWLLRVKISNPCSCRAAQQVSPAIFTVYLLQKISRQGVVRITAQHPLKQRSCLRLFGQTKLCLRLKKQCRRLLPELEIIIEQKHRRERSSEVIDFRLLSFELLRVSKQAAEELH